jgi:hypothetical protein
MLELEQMPNSGKPELGGEVDTSIAVTVQSNLIML